MTAVEGARSLNGNTKSRGSGAVAAPTCQYEGCQEPRRSNHPNARYCEPHRAEMRKKGWRNPVPVLTCEWCGKPIEDAYKGDQKYHRECVPDARRDVERQRTKVSDDPQMNRLFKNYQARDSIDITDRPDGTRLMIVSDAQIPFIDEPVWKAVLQFMGDFRPHDLIVNGDWIDAYEISDFDKRPQRLFDLQDELEMASGHIHDMKKRMAVGGNFYWIDGNHEERLNRTIWRHAQGFAFLVADVAEALKLDELAAGYVPYGKHIDYLGFVVTHGNFVRSASAATAKAHADRYHSSGVNGHTHRTGAFAYTDGRGKTHTWYEMGCLCRLDLEYMKAPANWQQAFLIGTVMNGALHPQLISIIDYEDGTKGFLAGGKHYTV